MIKKTHYIQLVMLIFLLFILFQITSISISFNGITDSSGDSEGIAVTDDQNRIDGEDEATIILITGQAHDESKYIEEELSYLKRQYKVYESLFSASHEDLENAEIIILASKNIENAYDLSTLKTYMETGINIIMAVLPEEIESDEDWKSLLGIKTIGNIFNQKGISTFSEFFLGGKRDYKELSLQARNIKVQPTSKAYIAGFSDDEDINNEDLPDLLWRNIYGAGQVFVVNGSFFNRENGIGILSAILSQIYEDFIYPVINAKALVIANAPYLSDENDDEMQKRYTRNSQRFFIDIALPDIIALSMSTGNAPTFFGVGSLLGISAPENELNLSTLHIVEGEIRRIGGEMGISTNNQWESYNYDKISQFIDIYDREYHIKEINSLYAGSSVDNQLIEKIINQIPLEVVVASWEYERRFSPYDSNIVYVPVITEGFSYSDEDLLKLHTTATSLGIIVHGIDMGNIVYPQMDDEDWSELFDELISAINTFWPSYDSIDGLNISETSNRVLRFLNMNPAITSYSDRIEINIEGFDKEAFFMLRTDKNILEIKNGSSTKIEEGAYLISAQDARIEISFE